MNNRKVIFIAGTDFSGSTMLDLMLGSLKNCRSVGEVHAFFRPTVTRQKSAICSCGCLCAFWEIASHLNEKEFYDYVFQKDKDTKTIIDSSKSLPWIKKNKRALKEKGYDVKTVLVWKNPYVYSKSRAKRGKGKDWDKSWLRYHEAFFYQQNEFYSIDIDSILQNFDLSLNMLCNWLEIDFEKSIQEYWHKNHHIIYGSATARLKLYPEGSEQYMIMQKSSFRTDVNEDAQSERINTNVYKAASHRLKKIDNIYKFLQADGVKNTSRYAYNSHFYSLLYDLKDFVMKNKFRLVYGDREELVSKQLKNTAN